MKRTILNFALIIVALFAMVFMLDSCDLFDKPCEMICPVCESCYDGECAEEGHVDKCECICGEEMAATKIAANIASQYKQTAAVTADIKVPNTWTVQGVAADHSAAQNYVASISWSVAKVSGQDGIVSVAADASDATKSIIGVKYTSNFEATAAKATATVTIGEISKTAEIEFTVPAIVFKTVAEFKALPSTDTNLYAVKCWVVADAGVGDKASSFEVADSTGSMFSYNKLAVELGDCITLVGSADSSRTIFQISSKSFEIRTPDAGEVNPYAAQKTAMAATDIYDGATVDLSTFKSTYKAAVEGKLVAFKNLFFKQAGDYVNVYRAGATSGAADVQILSTYGINLASYIGSTDAIIYGYVRDISTSYITFMVSEVTGKGALTVDVNRPANCEIKDASSVAVASANNIAIGTKYSVTINAVGEGMSIKSVMYNGAALEAVEGKYEFVVNGANTLSVVVFNANATDAERVAFEKETLAFTKDDANLLAGLAYDSVSVSWASDNAKVVIGADGKVTIDDSDLPNGVTNVTITATIKSGEATDTKTFTLPLIGYGSQESPLTLAQAKAIGLALTGEGNPYSGVQVYVQAKLSKDASYNSNYGNFNSMTLCDVTDSSVSVSFYRSWGEAANTPYKDDVILAHCWIQKYNGNAQLTFKDSTAKDSTFTIVSRTARTVTYAGEHASLAKLDDSAFDLAATYETGASLSFKVAAENNYSIVSVSAYNDELSAVDGVYTIVVKGNIKIEVETKDNSVVDNIKVATFEFGTNKTTDLAHAEGSNITTYTETNESYTLTLSNLVKVNNKAYDAKGNSCLKLGTSSIAGAFDFTVGADVISVKIYAAKYKANDTTLTINGTDYALTKASDDGKYDVIEIDTSVTKTINLSAKTKRAMINTIEFYKAPQA